jgi:protein CpxP
MNTIRKSIIIGLAALSLGATSFAAETTGAKPERQQMHAKWGERAAAHQKQLHDLLKLTPSQESAWGTFVAATKPAMHGERGERGERADWKAMPAPERMQKRIDMAKQHVAMMETHLAALNTFYAVLTPEQKKVFDANSMHGGRGGHRGHGMKHHDGQHAAS